MPECMPDQAIIARDERRAGCMHGHFPHHGLQIRKDKSNA